MVLNDNAKKWVEALRSGEYRQGDSYLYNKDTDCYCCLGVACRVYEQETENELENSDTLLLPDFQRFSTLKDYPEVQKWLGLRTPNGELDKGRDLTLLNDIQEKSFSEIADVIEEEVEILFTD